MHQVGAVECVRAEHALKYETAGTTAIDLTPAAVGPVVVPPANANAGV